MVWVRRVKMFDNGRAPTEDTLGGVGGDRGMAWFHQVTVTSQSLPLSWNCKKLYCDNYFCSYKVKREPHENRDVLLNLNWSLCSPESLEVFHAAEMLSWSSFFPACDPILIFECSIKEAHDATLADMVCHPQFSEIHCIIQTNTFHNLDKYK